MTKATGTWLRYKAARKEALDMIASVRAAGTEGRYFRYLKDYQRDLAALRRVHYAKPGTRAYRCADRAA